MLHYLYIYFQKGLFQLPNISEFDPIERLFCFPPNSIETETSSIEGSSIDLMERNKYTTKITTKSYDEQRLLRRDLDLRQPENRKAKNNAMPSSEQPCLHHIEGYCNHKPCLFTHQMRLPRQINVCKFYLTDGCTKGNMCNFMHSEFPCKYFYLGIPHPKNLEEIKCRFHHGDVLNGNVRQALLRSIEFWIKEKNGSNLEKFEQEYSEMCKKLDEHEAILKERNILDNQETNNDSIDETVEIKDNGNCLQRILTKRQYEYLTEHGITSVDQLKRLSTSTLEEYGLNIDQIYEIKVKLKTEVESSVETQQNETEADNILEKGKTAQAENVIEPNGFFYTETLSTEDSENRNNGEQNIE